MIYTLTFSPALDLCMWADEINFNKTNRSKKEQINVGGKGINVSLVLKELQVDSIALGFVGGFAVVTCLAVIAVRLLYLAMKCRDTVGRLICAGIAAVMICQTLENLFMCLAMVPVIGITLPFVSAGGSSMLALYMMMGLAHSVSAQEKKMRFSRER